MTDTLSPDTMINVTGRYLEFWNAGSPAEQERLGALTFTDDVVHTPPRGEVLNGPASLATFRNQLFEHVGKVEFRALGEPDGHHDWLRVRWEVIRDGERFAAGTDVLVLAADGRIRTVAGFVDQPPAVVDDQARG